MSFAQYYEGCTDEKRYHFKNIGERQVKACLPFVPRRDFRLLSRTYGGIPVISSSTMGNIFTELQRIVLKNETMREIYLGKIKRSTLDEFLEFQYAFVGKYVRVAGYASSLRKKQEFKKVLEDWENSFFLIFIE